MTYQELERITKRQTLPLCGKNVDGENVIIEQGKEPGSGNFFRLTTAQDNGWTRINILYENGDREEFFRK